MSNYQTVYEAYGLTAEQADLIQRMGNLKAFMYGFYGEGKEAELRQLGLIIDTRLGRVDCAKLSSAGKEIAHKLTIAEIDDIMAS
jgi:hypothetical protein